MAIPVMAIPVMAIPVITRPDYEAWRKQKPECDPQELEQRFVEKHWPKCVGYARESLAEMLKRPDVPEAAKAQITEVLAKDQSLVRGWARG